MTGEQAGPSVVGVGGSAGAASSTTGLLRRCLQHAERLGARTTMIAGDQLTTLPIYGAPGLPGAAAAVAAFVETMRTADCVILATPGYHGGMSGLLKNALDHLEALRTDPRPYLDGRGVGVIVGAAGWQACGTTLVSVRSTVHSLRGWPTPFGVTVNTAERRPDADGTVDDVVDGALATLAGQVVDFATWQAIVSASVR